jgi:hypothetical protein
MACHSPGEGLGFDSRVDVLLSLPFFSLDGWIELQFVFFFFLFFSFVKTNQQPSHAGNGLGGSWPNLHNNFPNGFSLVDDSECIFYVCKRNCGSNVRHELSFRRQFVQFLHHFERQMRVSSHGLSRSNTDHRKSFDEDNICWD